MARPTRLAVIVSHPIPYFAQLHRAMAMLDTIDLRVYFCCDWGLSEYVDPHFGVPVRWDVPLLDGYAHEFLPIGRRPRRLGFREVDNPAVGAALARFDPDVVQVFGYAHRTNWRAARWAHRRRRPVLLLSDSNAGASRPPWKRLAKRLVVGAFYRMVDGALRVSAQNEAYHLAYGIPRERLFPGALPIERGRLLGSVVNREETRKAVRRRHAIPENAFVVIYCGKYIGHKRPLDVLAAVETLAARGRVVWALMVGEGPVRGGLEAFCRERGIATAVLTGFINQTAIAEYYVAADVIALTSSVEPYGLVISEGAVFGLPAVVSDRVGCIGDDSAARPGVNALVYPCGDTAALADAIESLDVDRALYAKMSANAEVVGCELDVTVAARQWAAAATALHRLGPR